jgi:long-chain acyl-CoA synthetase
VLAKLPGIILAVAAKASGVGHLGIQVSFDMTGNITGGGDSGGEAGHRQQAALSVSELLQWQAQARGHCEALIYGQLRQTYSQLYARAGAIAQQLAQLGVTAGDKVGLLFANHPDYVAGFFATIGLGAVVVPINPLLRAEEIAHILTDSQAKAIVVGQGKLDEVLTAQDQVPQLEFILLSGADAAPASATTALQVLPLTSSSAAGPGFNWPLTGDFRQSLAVLVYTSGTTGKPKGAMLTHGNLIFAAGSAQSSFDVSAYDRFLAVLPLCHIYGLAIVMLGIIARGGVLVVSDKFEPQLTLQLIEKESVTFVPAVPAMYQFMLMELEKTAGSRDTHPLKIY